MKEGLQPLRNLSFRILVHLNKEGEPMKTCIGCEAGLWEEYLVDGFGQAYCLACWEGETLDGLDDPKDLEPSVLSPAYDT